MSQNLNIENLSLAWCEVIIETLMQAGVRRVFFSPGYRDAPFAAAMLGKDLELISCMDERAAGYQALGASKFDLKPSALICTSGTAVANYLPAVIEASQEQIPLIIISCDRPPELVHGGANQTIAQHNILGSYAKESMALPCPEDSLTAPMLQSMVRGALQRSLSYPCGVAHLNVPLRGPLEPRAEPSQRFDDFTASKKYLGSDAISGLSLKEGEGHRIRLKDFIESAERGVLVIGRLPQNVDYDALKAFASELGWPVFADISSSLKFDLGQLPDAELPACKDFLESFKPDAILHLGKRLVSKYWDQFLSQKKSLPYMIVTHEYKEQNPAFTPCQQFQTQDYAFLGDVRCKGNSDDKLDLSSWCVKAQEVLDADQVLHFPSFANALVASETQSNIFIGNSSAIRAFDTWLFNVRRRELRVEVNRGASGIEGLVSTAIGLCFASGEPWDVVLGDVSMIHDLNALFQLAQLDLPLRIFVINNAGGQIFKKLPLGSYPEVMDPLISTPHSFKFKGICGDASIEYNEICSLLELKELIARPCVGPHFVEVQINAEDDLAFYKTIKELPHGD